MERVRIEDGTVWPDPTGKDFKDIIWKLNFAHASIQPAHLFCAAEIISAYAELITHPAFTLEVVKKKIKGIREKIK